MRPHAAPLSGSGSPPPTVTSPSSAPEDSEPGDDPEPADYGSYHPVIAEGSEEERERNAVLPFLEETREHVVKGVRQEKGLLI